MQLRPGLRLASAVCDTTIVVVRAPSTDVDLRCGGAAMVAFAPDVTRDGEPDPQHAGGTAVGKRYASAAGNLEVICTSPGAGSLSVGEEPLPLLAAKPLPSSD